MKIALPLTALAQRSRPRRLLAGRWHLAFYFSVIGTAWVIALWVGLYRIVPIAFVAVTLLAATAPVVRTGVPVYRGLVIVGPVYVYALVSSVWAPDPGASLRDAIFTCISVFPAIVFGMVLVRRFSLLQIGFGVGFFALPFALQALYNLAIGLNMMSVGDATMRSILGGIVCLSMPVVAGAWILTRKRCYLLLLLVHLALTVTIESRSTVLIGLPATLIAMWMVDHRFTRRLLARWFPVLLVGVLLAAPMALNRFGAESTNFDIGDTVFEELNKPPEERVDFDRRLTNFTALVTFAESPIFGMGYMSIYQTHLSDYGIELSAHGLIPGTLAELGIVGVGILVLVLWRVHRRARRALRKPYDPMLRSFLIAFYAQIGMGLFHQLAESVLFGVALGLLIALGFDRQRGDLAGMRGTTRQ